MISKSGLKIASLSLKGGLLTQLFVEWAPLVQFRMAADVDNLTILHNNNSIGLLNGG